MRENQRNIFTKVSMFDFYDLFIVWLCLQIKSFLLSVLLHYADSLYINKKTADSDSLMRGRRLFYTLSVQDLSKTKQPAFPGITRSITACCCFPGITRSNTV
jgi:hypothetical protein